MRIERVLLKGFKRLRLSNIHQIEIDFKSNIAVIIGTNGSGKTSLMRELCPLPASRPDYEPGGKKELHVTHENHYYILTSDFSNRNSPHSFLMDNVELNVSGTTDVQTELVEQHFGITPTIRNLIYSKVTLCQTTKAERKNLFLSINPMELGLILDTHKKALGKVKDCKANLQMLNTKRAEIEGKLIPLDILQQHKVTKEKLNNELMAVDKIIYGLEQHVGTLRNRFKEDLEYRQQCVENNTQLVPTENILMTCKNILQDIRKFRYVKRGEDFHSEKERLFHHGQMLVAQKRDLMNTAANLSEEINEYVKHIENSNERSVSVIEKEIAEVDKELDKYKEIPNNPISPQHIEIHRQKLENMKNMFFIFRDAEVKMMDPKILSEKINKKDTLENEIKYLNIEITSLKNTDEEFKREVEQIKTNAGVPDSCTLTTCGLRNIMTKRVSAITEKIENNKARLVQLEKDVAIKEKELNMLKEEVTPFEKDNLLTVYFDLLYQLTNSQFSLYNWNEILVEKLQQPLLLMKELDDFIARSVLADTFSRLKIKKQQLMTEIDVLIKSNNTSVDFLTKKLKSKEEELKKCLDKLNTFDNEIFTTNQQYNLYLEYSTAIDKIEEFRQKYSRGERALMVAKAIDYWNGLQKYFMEAKRSISEELRNLETLVREQENFRSTYEEEGVWIRNIENDKLVYERIEQALSPTTGLPHKSMVKYLNAMINNVNYFLSQIWSYKMKILPLNEELPLDYSFKIEVGQDTSNDISQLSDGQFEVVNLAWVLTILLQLRMLDKIPLFADELGRTFDPTHRAHILSFLNQLMDSKIITQLFMINHFAALSDGFQECDVICLNHDNMPELPKNTNEFVRIL